MPIYEYECKKCGERFESFETLYKDNQYRKVKCPKCGAEETYRIYSRFATGSSHNSCGGLSFT